jgi:DNA transformation protein
MGEKGSKQTAAAAEAAELLTDALASLGEVGSKRMYGSYGIFGDEAMFALVDSAGVAHLRGDAATASKFEDAGGHRHSRMPYWAVPDAVMSNHGDLVAWGAEALEVARAAK